MKLQKTFEFCPERTYGNMFSWARKLKKKEGIQENNITTFNTLKSGFICQREKKHYFEELRFRTSTQVQIIPAIVFHHHKYK